jgi:two-component system sensor histidine kinase CpxA
MKSRKLYVRIFLSFLLVLIVAQILVFGLFLFSAKRMFLSRFKQHYRAQVDITKEFVEERIRSEPGIHPAENEPLRDLILRLAEAHQSKIWLAAPDGTPLLKSFSEAVPDDAIRAIARRATDFGDFRMYSDFKKGRLFYIVIPTEIHPGEVGSLHLLSERHEKADHHEGLFALGLVGICIVIALLLVPVSRLITNPLNRLKESALRIAEGNLSHRAVVKSRDEIGELGRAFNLMADKLERMIRGGRELTANISHELRSPLARIRIAEELLRKESDPGNYEAWERHLDDIREDIGELDRLIDHILALSKLDVHETTLRRERLDPSAMVKALLEKFQPTISHRNLRVTQDLKSDRPLLGDRDALHTAFSNILENAVKFTPKNGDLTVRLDSDNGSLKISVTNSFEPLSEEDLARVFDPFYRVDRSDAAGSGLGLAITKKIIEQHGGSIEASNSPEGLRIQICLPVYPSE